MDGACSQTNKQTNKLTKIVKSVDIPCMPVDIINWEVSLRVDKGKRIVCNKQIAFISSARLSVEVAFFNKSIYV